MIHVGQHSAGNLLAVSCLTNARVFVRKRDPSCSDKICLIVTYWDGCPSCVVVKNGTGCVNIIGHGRFVVFLHSNRSHIEFLGSVTFYTSNRFVHQIFSFLHKKLNIIININMISTDLKISTKIYKNHILNINFTN